MTLELAQNMVAHKDGYKNFDYVPEHLQMEYMKRAAHLYAESNDEIKKSSITSSVNTDNVNIINVDEKLNKQVKISLQMFFDSQNIIRHTLEITDVEIKDLNTTLDITITLARPGILIGKGGQTVTALVEYLETWFKKSVKLNIIESKLWL